MQLPFLLQIQEGGEAPGESTGVQNVPLWDILAGNPELNQQGIGWSGWIIVIILGICLLYTSDAADD